MTGNRSRSEWGAAFSEAPEAVPRVGGAAFEPRPSASGRPSQWPVGSGGLPPSSGLKRSQPDPGLFLTRSEEQEQYGVRVRSARAKAGVNAFLEARPAPEEMQRAPALMRVSARSERARMG